MVLTEASLETQLEDARKMYKPRVLFGCRPEDIRNPDFVRGASVTVKESQRP